MTKLSGEAQIGVTWGEPEIGVLKYKLEANFDIEHIKNEEIESNQLSSNKEDSTNQDESEDMVHCKEIT